MNTLTTSEKAEKKGWLCVYNNKICFPGWKQRWVVLYRNPSPRLCLYADRSECVLEEEAKCSIDLSGVKVLAKPKYPLWGKAFNVHHSRQYVFQLLTDNSTIQPLIFAASNYQEKERWIYAISEIHSPLVPTKKTPEPTRYKLPNDSDMFPVLSKSQILANSPSCAVLQECVDNIFNDSFMVPFNKKEIALMKRVHVTNFAFSEFDSLLDADYSKQEIESLTSDDVLKCYHSFLKFPISSNKHSTLERKTLLFGFLRKFKQYSMKIGMEIFEKHFAPPNQFNKCFKFGSCIMVEFLCDYASNNAQCMQQLLKLDALLKGQAKVLDKLLLSQELSVDLFTAVEYKGFVLLVKLFIPEPDSGVKLDNEQTIRDICGKLSVMPSKTIEVAGYELSGKLFTHVRYNLENFATDALYDFKDAQWLHNLPNSTRLEHVPILRLLSELRNREFLHVRYFCLVRLFSFLITALVNEKLASFYLANHVFSCVEEQLVFLNSINDAEFFDSVLEPKIAEFLPSLSTQDVTRTDFETIDKRHLLKSILHDMHFELKNPFIDHCTVKSSDILPVKNQDLFQLNWVNLNCDSMEKLHILLGSKFPPRKLGKDAEVAECFLDLTDRDNYNGDQKLLLSCFATYFCPSCCPLLLSKCLVNFFHFAYDSNDKVANASSVLHRIKSELKYFYGFDSLNSLDIYVALGEATFSLKNFSFSLALYQECLTACCKYLGRNHPRSIVFQERISECYMFMGQYDNALVSLHECLRFRQELQNFMELGKILLSISRCLFLKGDISGCLEFSDKCLVVLRNLLREREFCAIFVEALMFQAKVCESQFALVDSLTSIITPQIRYFLSQAEQSYEQIVDYVKSTLNSTKAQSELYEIVEKLVRISMLLLDATTKEYIMMAVRKLGTSICANVEPMERDNFILKCITVLPSKLFSSLAQLPLNASQEVENNRERIFYVACKISSLE